jgi:RNA recognition motif-containing protein
MRDPKTGASKGYAFVRYMEPTFAELAADQLSGYLIMVRPVFPLPSPSASCPGSPGASTFSLCVQGRPVGVLVSQDNQSLFVGHISQDWSLEQLEAHLKEAGIRGVDHIIFQHVCLATTHTHPQQNICANV